MVPMALCGFAPPSPSKMGAFWKRNCPKNHSKGWVLVYDDVSAMAFVLCKPKGTTHGDAIEPDFPKPKACAVCPLVGGFGFWSPFCLAVCMAFC